MHRRAIFFLLLRSRMKVITFCCTSSHLELTGIETGDRETKAGSSFCTCSLFLPVHSRIWALSADYYPALREGLRSRCRECWTVDQLAMKLRYIKLDIGKWSFTLTNKITCRKQFSLTFGLASTISFIHMLDILTSPPANSAVPTLYNLHTISSLSFIFWTLSPSSPFYSTVVHYI